MFPSSPSYSCPGPSLSLKCEFPVGATTVLWSAPRVNHIPDGFSGHVIDRSMLENGVAYLHVNSSFHLKNSYRCIVVYPNKTTEYQQETIPEPASKLLHNAYIAMKNVDTGFLKACPVCV